MNRIAIAQLTVSRSKRENLNAVCKYIKEAKSKGAVLVAFPEFLMAYSPRDQSAEELCQLAEPIAGEFVSSLRQAASEARINLLATVYEKSKSPNRVYDTALWIDPRGEIAAAYRKLHLYDALGFKESEKLVAGDDCTPPFSTDIGPVGILICYDVRFPELSRILALAGADTLIAPSAWVRGEMKMEHWQTMIRARALENGCYVIAPDQAGNIYVGHSLVIDPFGRVIVDMGDRQGLETADIDPELVRQVRRELPLLDNRRQDIYAKYFIPPK